MSFPIRKHVEYSSENDWIDEFIELNMDFLLVVGS